jgi:hypothetical protein
LVKSSWGLAHPMSLTELTLLDGRRPLPLGDVIGLTLTLTLFSAGGSSLSWMTCFGTCVPSPGPVFSSSYSVIYVV